MLRAQVCGGRGTAAHRAREDDPGEGVLGPERVRAPQSWGPGAEGLATPGRGAPGVTI